MELTKQEMIYLTVTAKAQAQEYTKYIREHGIDDPMFESYNKAIMILLSASKKLDEAIEE